jgi:hypothetical protein
MFPLCGFEFCSRSLVQWRIHRTSSSHSAQMDVSRRIYFQKLLAEFPDDPVRGLHYRDDVIVPRFFLTYLLAFQLAHGDGNAEKCNQIRRDLFATIGPFLSWRRWAGAWLLTRKTHWSRKLLSISRRMPRALRRLV